jgi:chaperone modulatory protein CbpM
MILSEKECLQLIEGLTPDRLQSYMREGWIRPSRQANEPAFDQIDLARFRLIVQLCDDLDLTEDALPVVLSLVDQVHGLRRELRILARAIEAQPPMVVTKILEQIRGIRRYGPDGPMHHWSDVEQPIKEPVDD